MRFVANLRQETIEVFSAEAIQPAAYLLSSHRISPASLRMAAVIRSAGLPLFADNGSKAAIEDIAAQFASRAKLIAKAVRAIRDEIGRSPRKADIPGVLRDKAAALAAEVVDHATSVSDAIDPKALLASQLSMAPSHLIAQEDFATACLIALDLERELTGWTVTRWKTRNRRSVRLWEKAAADPRCAGLAVYAVLSAMDYETGRAAGRIAAEKGVEHAALGIAGINLDLNATDHFTIAGEIVKLERPAPRRYVRLAQILKGVADGFADAGRPLKSFHCLGLGAPAMLPIVAAALPDATVLTTDATSPIHDAVRDHILYDPKRQGDRASRVEIVNLLVRGKSWPLTSPFTKAYRRKFGHAPVEARNAWRSEGQPPITAAFLKFANGITDALPLLSTANPVTTLPATKAHIAHNHWVLEQLCGDFVDAPGRRDLAKAAMRAWIDRKASSATTRGVAASLQVIEAAGG